MRNFLVRLKIGNVEYEGPNATYIGGWNRLDIAVGICPELTGRFLPERMSKMPAAVVAEVARGLQLPALSEVVSTVLGIAPNRIQTIAPDELATRMQAAPAELHAALAAACDLAHQFAKMVGVHWGVIRNNLLIPTNAAAGMPAVTTTHSADEGVSGRALSITENLKKMRLTHPLARAKFKPAS